MAADFAVNDGPGISGRASVIAGSRLAGFWSRVGASIVDGLFLWVVVFVIFVLLLAVGGRASGVLVILVYAFPVVYYIWGWSSWSGGQSLGKRALNQRVVKMDGQPLTKMQAFGRFLGAIISALPLGLGYLWAAWDPQNQTWHDKMVGSYVVRTGESAAMVGAAQQAGVASGSEPSRMPCPRCGESITTTAKVCRFCGVEFEPRDTVLTK